MDKFGRKNVQSVRFEKCDAPNVFVGGIRAGVDLERILDYIGGHCFIEHFEIPRDPSSGESSCYAKAQLHGPGIKFLFGKPNHNVGGTSLSFKPWVTRKDYLFQKDENNKKKIFVRYHPLLNQTELYSYFSEFGCIEEVDCKVNPKSKKPRNFGFITYKFAEDAEKATRHGNLFTRYQKIWCELVVPKFQVTKKKSGGGPSSKGKQNSGMESPIQTNRLCSFEDLQAESVKLERELRRDCQQTEDASKSQQFDSCSMYGGGMPCQDRQQPRDNKSLDLEMEAPKKQEQFAFKFEKGGDRSKVDDSSPRQLHAMKPTSKRYPISARTNVEANHRTTTNILFRLV